MISAAQFRLVAVQTAVFTPEHGEFNAAKLVIAIIKSFPDRFQGQLQALPMPGDVPAEVPRVILESPDTAWKIEAGPARTNAFWIGSNANEAADLSSVVVRCSEVPEAYVREAGVRVGRLGLLVSRACRVDNPAQVLIQRFCNAESQAEPLNRSASFEIHNHKEYNPQRPGLNLPINSWVRCRTAMSPDDGLPIIVVEQDLNTLATQIQDHRFDAEQMRAYFEAAAAESETVFRRYFPG